MPQQAHHDGLPPSAGFWRHVTSVERDEDGDTVFLNNDDEGWSVPRAVAWLEVSTETAAYYIQRTPPAERKELLALAYLTTAPGERGEQPRQPAGGLLGECDDRFRMEPVGVKR